MTLDFSRCRLPPFQHQREDVPWLLERPYAFITNEMRTGKSKTVIDAMQFLYEAGTIDKVIIVAPAPVRDVWYDEQLGELAKHLWADLPAVISEYHARRRYWLHDDHVIERRLEIFVTNYEFLRSKNRLTSLLPACGPKTLLVLDESSFVKNYAAAQTKACVQLRKACGRVALLNGTPIFLSPLDLFSQGNLLHQSVLDCKFITLFKARYAVQEAVLGRGGRPLVNPRGGAAIQRITGWRNLDDLQRRFAPITIRRLQKDCLDLPPKLDPVTLTATLTPETWKAYKAMRDELVVWLSSSTVATSATAAVKALRLSQITGGFIGGVEGARTGVEPGLFESLDLEGEQDVELTSELHRSGSDGSCQEGVRKSIDFARGGGKDTASFAPGLRYGWNDAVATEVARVEDVVGIHNPNGVQGVEIGREKLDVLLWFIGQQLEADPNVKIVAWGRFRAEVFRAEREVRAAFLQMTTAVIMGGQKRDERLRALALLKPETAPTGPVFVAGIEGTGSFGLDFTASHTCVTMSSGYSPGRSAQTLDRTYGPGQTAPVAYYSIIATGPTGQKTIDHAIEVARREGADVASWVAADWVRALKEE